MSRSAISLKEFRQMLLSSRPPTGWGDTIAVAHSGGADSTCLLYLLHRLVLEQKISTGIPRRITSLSVDHCLQPNSAAVADHCRKFSNSLQVPHFTLNIPWGSSPFPERPEGHRPYEGVARAARYRVLLDAMEAFGATVIAMGHHADDNVETLLMRLTRHASDTTTPVGMRSCRRWGMGSKTGALDWAGLEGMNRWIVRPLLGLSKERILATCALHGLSYVDDPTNFQPSLTSRNYIRHYLSKGPHQQADHDVTRNLGDDSPVVKNLDNAIRRLDAMEVHLHTHGDASTSNRARLYAAADHLSRLQDQIDQKVNQYLNDYTRRSPPSTLFLCVPPLELLPPPEIRRAIILRVLRYVSPRPWGSPSSEVSRRSASLDLIGDMLWNSSTNLRKTFTRHKTFTAGSDVMWSPVSVQDDGRIRLECVRPNVGQFGWLASRQPPIRRTGSPSPCVLDISELLISERPQDVLWDNRFQLRFRPHHLSSDILESCRSSASVVIRPHGRWLLPQIVWQQKGRDELHLGGVDLSDKIQRAMHVSFSKWVDIKFIRSIDVL